MQWNDADQFGIRISTSNICLLLVEAKWVAVEYWQSRMNSTKSSAEGYFSSEFRLGASACYGFLSVVGIVGNVLVVAVVFRLKHMVTPTNCYLVSLAISDCLFFVAAGPSEIMMLNTPMGVYVFGSSACSALSYLSYLAINASSLSITAFTVERYIGICHPIKARYLCTVKRARVIIVCIWLFSIVYNSPWLYLAQLKPIDIYFDLKDAYQCTFQIERTSWTYKVIFLIDFTAFYIVPMLLYLLIYGRIAYELTTTRLRSSSKCKPVRSSVVDDVVNRSSISNNPCRHMASVSLRPECETMLISDDGTSCGGHCRRYSEPHRRSISLSSSPATRFLRSIGVGHVVMIQSNASPTDSVKESITPAIISAANEPRGRSIASNIRSSNNHHLLRPYSALTKSKHSIVEFGGNCKKHSIKPDVPQQHSDGSTSKTSGTLETNKTSMVACVTPTSFIADQSLNTRQRESFVTGKASKGRGQVVKMLAVIVLVFAICWLPYRALVMYNSFNDSPWTDYRYLFFAKKLIFINCAINPILYNVMSARFRNAFQMLLRYGCSSDANYCASVKSQLYNSTMGAVAAPYRPRSIVGDQLGGDSTASNSRKLSQPAVMPSTLEVTRNRISNRHSAATQHEHTPSLTGTASLIERRLMANGFGRTEHSSSAPKVSFTPADASVAIGGQPPLYHAEARRCLSQDHINVTRLAPDRLLQSPPRIST